MSRIWGAVCRLHSGYSTSVTKKCVIMLAHLVFGYLTGSPLVTEENYALAMNLLYMIEKYCPWFGKRLHECSTVDPCVIYGIWYLITFGRKNDTENFLAWFKKLTVIPLCLAVNLFYIGQPLYLTIFHNHYCKAMLCSSLFFTFFQQSAVVASKGIYSSERIYLSKNYQPRWQGNCLHFTSAKGLI